MSDITLVDCAFEKLHKTYVGILRAIELSFEAEGNRAGEMKREMDEEWDTEEALKFDARREAFFQAESEVMGYRIAMEEVLERLKANP
jgi:hypothetical protein